MNDYEYVIKVKVCSAIFIRVLYVLCLYKPQISGERLQDHWSSGSHIWEWQLFWSCDPDAVNKVSFLIPKEAPHKIWL